MAEPATVKSPGAGPAGSAGGEIPASNGAADAGGNNADPSDLYRGYEAWKGWDTLFAYSPDQAQYFRGEARGIAVAGAKVLEIGFGSGAFLQWACDQGAEVRGTEINAKLLEAARTRGVGLLPAAFERTAHQHAEGFDTIVAFDVFEHFALEDIVRRLAAVETMLKPGGHLLLRFPNAQSPFGLAPQHGDPTHRSFLSRSVFEQLAQGSAFKVVRYGGAYRAAGTGLARRIVRLGRRISQDLVSGALNFVYATSVPMAPVVVLVLRKRG